MTAFVWYLPSVDVLPDPIPVSASAPPGYGATPYGTGPYGVLAGIELANAWASSNNTVRVETTTPMLVGLGYEDGSALRPSTWTVANLRTGQQYTVLGAQQVAADAVDLVLLEPLGPYQEQHRVVSTTLRNANGNIITGNVAADFAGVVATYNQGPDEVALFRARDLANPSLFARPTGAPGTLVIGAGGDYQTEVGESLVVKLVTRRLTTPRGSIRHLPDYGTLLAVKEPVPNRGNLNALRVDIERQAELEPEVARSNVSLSMSRDGVLSILVKLVLRITGGMVDIRLRSLPGTGQIFVP